MKMIPPIKAQDLRELLTGSDGYERAIAYINGLIEDTNKANTIAFATARGALAQETEIITIRARSDELLAANTREVERRRAAERHISAIAGLALTETADPRLRAAISAARNSLNPVEK